MLPAALPLLLRLRRLLRRRLIRLQNHSPRVLLRRRRRRERSFFSFRSREKARGARRLQTSLGRYLRSSFPPLSLLLLLRRRRR